MKKTCKKIVSFALALAMFATAVPFAIAEEEMQPDVTIHITEDCLDRESGRITLDLSAVTDAILEENPWMPGRTSKVSVKIINDLAYPLTFHGWSVSWPEYDVDPKDPQQSTMTGATGADGNLIPLGLNIYRTCNKPICDLYGKTQTALTLADLVLVNEKITDTYRDTATPITTYAEYLCLYYGVHDLSEISNAQAAEILDGNRGVRTLGNLGTHTENDPEFYYVKMSGSRYCPWEVDRAVIELGYNFYWGKFMAFSLDDSLVDLNAKYQTVSGAMVNLTNDSAHFDDFAAWGIGQYADSNSAAYQKTIELLSDVRLEKAGEAGDSVMFPSMQLAINGPMTKNAYMDLEVPNLLQMSFSFAPDSCAVEGTVFQDIVRDNTYTEDDKTLSGSQVSLLMKNETGEYEIQKTFTVGEDGAYLFEGLQDGELYRVQVTYPAGMNRVCATVWSEENPQGSRVLVGNSGCYADFTAVAGKTQRINAGYYWERSSSDSHPKPSVTLDKENHYAYIIGYPDGLVRPENTIDREEVATIFFRLLTNETRTDYWSKQNEYPDVSVTDWSNNAISTLTRAGIVEGDPDGSFRPEDAITRAEFAAIAARFDELLESEENPFSDISGHWAERYILSAVVRGWVTGYPDGSFKPNRAITRAEAMTLVNNVLERHVKREHLLENMAHWMDNDNESAWYYTAVQEATNSHDYTQEGSDETWKNMLPARDWAALEKNWSDVNDGYQDSDIYPKNN